MLNVESFNSTSSLSLGYWDSIYYALVVKIRNLHQHMTNTDDEEILHIYDTTGNTNNQPYTLRDFRRLLGNVWALLIDLRLLGPLERAVRMQNYAESFRTGNNDHAFRQDFEVAWAGYTVLEKDEILDRMTGMKDVLRMRMEQIDDHLKGVCIENNRRACLEELATTEPPKLSLSDENPCCCAERCGCRIVCQFGIHECQCKKKRTAPTPYQSSLPTPARPRTNTTGRILHSVHGRPRRLAGGGKQVYPTELYREMGSFQRYPRFTPSSPEQEGSVSPAPPTTMSPESASRPVGRRLVSAGGDLPFSERPLLSAGLPEPQQGGGFTLSAAQYAALPLPRRAASSPCGGEAKAPRRPSWVKNVFSRKNSSSE